MEKFGINIKRLPSIPSTNPNYNITRKIKGRLFKYNEY